MLAMTLRVTPHLLVAFLELMAKTSFRRYAQVMP
jgi:hypothetical protein